MEESTTDPKIALFQSKYTPLAGAGSSGTFYLQSSPELALKRALVSGAKAIFHAGSVFRNGEADATHRPEFLMLEFYRVGADLNDLMNETEAFVSALFREAKEQGFTPRCTFDGTFERLRLPELFKASTGVDLLASFKGEDLARTLEAQGLGPFPEDSEFEEVFHQALVERVQERLKNIPASFVYDYPAPLALLSRLDPEDSRIARRVEAYIGATEIANGFEELTDADEYRRRFTEDLRLRSKRGLPLPPMPEGFLTSMELGLPPCAGIALGLDRLIQLACGAEDLSEITSFVVPE
jgi:lysyl-tRNA synthetase class 2